jgi:hypothetical protein
MWWWWQLYHAEVGGSHARDAGVAAHLLEEAEEEVDYSLVELGHPRVDHLQALGRIVGHQHALVTAALLRVCRVGPGESRRKEMVMVYEGAY